MFTVECRVGRLVEARVTVQVLSMQALDQGIAIGRSVLARRTEPIVVCADMRAAKVFSPEVSQRFLEWATVVNVRLVRSAILVSPQNPTSVLQNERMSRETGHPQRRTFRDPAEVRGWLGEVLTPAEQRRLEEFLASYIPE